MSPVACPGRRHRTTRMGAARAENTGGPTNTPPELPSKKGVPIMAARFHHPPRPGRLRVTAARLRPVPDQLATVLPMPRPAARPSRLVVLTCVPCGLTADPTPAAEAEQAAGAHDDIYHSGRPTAELHTVHTLRLSSASSRGLAGGPDLGGAA